MAITIFNFRMCSSFRLKLAKLELKQKQIIVPMRRLNLLIAAIVLCIFTACKRIEITLPEDNLPYDTELVEKAKGGDEDAALELGRMGAYVEVNKEEAVRWYRLAAEQGLGGAIERLRQLGMNLSFGRN